MTAWKELHSNAKSVCPILQMKPVVEEKDAQAYFKTLEAWAIHSGVRPISVFADQNSVGLLQTTLSELSPRANLRLALHASNATQLWSAAQDLNNEFRSGVVVIAGPSDTKFLPWLVEQQKKIQIDVILNFGQLSQSTADFADYIAFTIRKFQNLGIENLAFHAGSYPTDNTGMGYDRVCNVERKEWQMWKSVCRDFPDLSFSDCGPLSHHVNGKQRVSSKTIVPALRYTDSDSWKVHRGRRDGWDEFKSQTAAICRAIFDAAYFCGDYFSWGDLQIAAAAEDATKAPGNWLAIRAIEINHHLSMVANQLASLSLKPVRPEVPQVTD